MASILTTNSQKGDHLIFEEIFDFAYNDLSKHTRKICKRMVTDGVIQMETLVELAISNAGKLPRESVEGRDFVDGSDAKKVTTCALEEPLKGSFRRVATVTNVANKHGLLRVVIAETVSDKVYYFAIPKHAYQNLKTIRIYFSQDGTPRFNKWAKFQCESFEDMCQVRDDNFISLNKEVDKLFEIL